MVAMGITWRDTEDYTEGLHGGLHGRLHGGLHVGMYGRLHGVYMGGIHESCMGDCMVIAVEICMEGYTRGGYGGLHVVRQGEGRGYTEGLHVGPHVMPIRICMRSIG